MHSPESLLDFHERAHRNLADLLGHCGDLSQEELHCKLPGFGYGTVQLQLHHVIICERYWIGVLEGRMDVDDDAPAYPTVDSLASYREKVFQTTQSYLRQSSVEELNTPRSMMTWGNKEKILVPAQVIVRTQTHLYHHQGQVTVMCGLQGHPVSGVDYPID